MKTKEELNALKTELETLEKKVMELDEEELKQIAGGMITFEPMRELMKKGGVEYNELLNHTDMKPAEIQRIRVSPSKRKYIERYAELLDQLTPKTEE